VFRQSVLANMLNPKVTLFFLVFLPQFVDPWAGRSDTQMLMLGMIFMVQAAVIFCLIACCAGFLGGILRRRPQTGKYLDWLAGAVFLLLAVRIVWLS
jgi:threonine/homoserine/homoserine lactone efflux protein